jgi:uncharacterized protein
MQAEILVSNITNPTLLFFVLGIFAVFLKSDLEIPAQSVKFISLYLLLSIGFKGGQEFAHSTPNWEMALVLVFGAVCSAIIPIYVFFVAKRKLSVADSGAIAAAYGSVSAVTFVSAIAFLEALAIPFSGYMVAVMALMEVPAIIVGVALIGLYESSQKSKTSIASVIRHSLTNGSVFLITGSLLIGIFADTKQAEGIKPFTNDIFKGFLAIFLLEMGMVTARRISAFKTYGSYAAILALVLPLLNGAVAAYASGLVTADVGNRFLLAVLAASASYIAVPAAMKLAAPTADPGLFVPMAVGVTFPFNITIGMPLFLTIVRATG